MQSESGRRAAPQGASDMAAVPDILVVDDEAPIRMLWERFLGRWGYAHALAENGQQALDQLRATPYQLVVTDLTMPAMRGIEFAQRVWAVRPDLPVILTTGFSTLTTDAVRQLGMAELVLKPYTLLILGEAVHRVLAITPVRTPQ